jgi:preprotein translocase subunit YajC
MQIVVLLLMLPAFYFLLIRPQQKKLREQQELMASLEVGDDVMTTGGIYGEITLIDGEVLLVQVADGVELRISRAAIAELVEYEDPDAADEDDDE